ncbi:hypothetical protein Q75_00825 [Bacillus coahuilensis p1.1.43]|uniref:Uncharacterized protein n=1 Tax=Bacillus coahuilensis p1.1.43 TaxID=1150625 RepID=A0A147KCD6_9BACI|nr:hypothetical protein [Bacillus coahuilensis]KUP09206.1 hypothetical protein Q75_00825 [Bacillus coahuilensis p1.1.43]
MLVIGLLLVPLFLFSLYISLKFTWGEAGKSEEGKALLHRSYVWSAPIFPIGWLLLESYHKYIQVLHFETYRTTIWILVLLTFIIQGAFIFRNKKSVSPVI